MQLFHTTISILCLVVLLLLTIGCEPALNDKPIIQTFDGESPEVPMCAYYSPAKVDILPLTDFVVPQDQQESPTLNIYVALLDTFGCQIKYPAVFRFELYEYLQRASDHRGQRLVLWPDIDISDPSLNNHYWRDYLRAYLFKFEFDPARPDYVLEVTCISTYGKRISSKYHIKHSG